MVKRKRGAQSAVRKLTESRANEIKLSVTTLRHNAKYISQTPGASKVLSSLSLSPSLSSSITANGGNTGLDGGECRDFSSLIEFSLPGFS